MSNAQLQSLVNSPSYNIFMENSTMSPMIYTLDKSVVPLSRNKYELSFSSSTKFGSSVSFDLLRVGILDSIVLKLRATGFSADKTTYGGWINALKSVHISSHNKRLLSLTPDNILQRIARMPKAVRDQIESSCQLAGVRPNDYNDDINDHNKYGRVGLSTATDADATYGIFGAKSRKESTGYVYLPFSIFDDLRTKCSFDMEFVENLQLDIEFADKMQLIEPAVGTATLTANPVLDTVNSKVIVSYLDMMSSDLKKFENENFKIEGADLNLVCQDYYKEAVPATLKIKGSSTNAEAVGTADGRVAKFKIPISCRNLITAVMIRVQNKKTQSGLEGVKVLKIALNLDGKEFLSVDGEELNLISSVAGGVSVPNVASNFTAHGNQSGHDIRENFYEIKFSQAQSNAFSGGLSARSTASPNLVITVPATRIGTADDYECIVNCEIISLLSISQLDGKISKSQNL